MGADTFFALAGLSVFMALLVIPELAYIGVDKLVRYIESRMRRGGETDET